MYKALICLLFIIAIPVALAAASVRADWKNDGVVIADDTYENIEIVPLADDRYRMYFSQLGSIYSAVSDDGLSWVKEEGVRVSGAGMPALLSLDETTSRIYFTRVLDGKNAVYSALTTDGLTFTEEAGTRLQAGHPGGYDALSGIVHPTVIQLANGKFRLYYDTLYTQGDGDNPWHILSAVSDDGLNFTIERGIRIKGKRDLPKQTQSVWSPHIQKRDDIYQLFITAQYDTKPLTRNGIYLATSKDGKKFTVQPEPVVYRSKSTGKKKNTDKGMNGAPQDPFVLKQNGQETIYYWIVDQGILRAHQVK